MIECGHPEGGQRHYAVSWQAARVCKVCFDTAAAANRVPTRHVGQISSVYVHGTGHIAPKPALDMYDRAI